MPLRIVGGDRATVTALASKPATPPATGGLPTSDARVLIIDADPTALQVVKDCVHGLGHTVCAAVASLGQATAMVGEPRPDVALIGLAPDQGTDGGVEATERFRVRFDAPLVYLVDPRMTDDALLDRARRTAPCGYVVKPVDPRQLRLTIDAALCARAHERTLRERITELQRRVAIAETALDCTDDAVLATDTDGRVLTINPAARRLIKRQRTGGDPADWYEEYDYFCADGRTPLPKEDLAIMRAVRGESSHHVEQIARSRDGEEVIHYTVNGRPLRDPAGRLMGGVTIFRDTTPLHQTKARLQESVSELQRQKRLMVDVLNSMSDGVVAVDDRGRSLVVNDAARRLMDYPHDSPVSIKRWSEALGIYRADGVTICPPDELPIVRALHGEQVDNVELCIRPPGRSRAIPVAASGRPLRSESGALHGAVVVLRDVTTLQARSAELTRTAAQLHERVELMDAIFNNMSDCVVVADVSGQFTMFNPSARRTVGVGETGTRPSEWPEKYGVFLTDGVTRVADVDLPLVRALRGEATDDYELFIRNVKVPDGVTISGSARPLRDASGNLTGGVSVFRDVTRQVRTREALTQAFAAGRLEVIETVLHNIGNAINTVAVGVESTHSQLQDNELVSRLTSLADAVAAHHEDWIPWLTHDPQGRQVRGFIVSLAHDIATQNQRMIRTATRVRQRVQHIVDIIRTQAFLTRGSLQRQIVRLDSLIGDAVKVLDGSFAKRAIQVESDCTDVPVEIRIQESAFVQVLINLIKNAVEAIDERACAGTLDTQPSIRILAYVRGPHLVVDIVDNGIGVRPERADLIFTAGYTTKESGKGLGLHSAASFATANGGNLRAYSEGLNCGTTMRLRLPLSTLSPGEGSVKPRPSDLIG